MSNREKIIIVLAIIAALYGGYELVLSPRFEKPEKITPDNNIEALKIFLDKTIEGLVDADPDAPKQTKFLKLASQSWLSDPFLKEDLPLKLAEEKMAEITAEDLNLTYSGYLDAGKKLAVINGHEYEIGEELETVSLIIKAITPTMVIVGPKDTGERVVIAIDESE